MHLLPTVRVVNLAAPARFTIINRSDLTADHELWPGEEPNPVAADTEFGLAARIVAKLMAQKDGLGLAEWQAQTAEDRMAKLREAEREIDAAVARAPMRVAKGPGGRWFVFRGGERVSTGYPDEATASAELALLSARA